VSSRPERRQARGASPYAVLAGSPEGGLWWMTALVSAGLAIGLVAVAGQMHGTIKLLLLIVAAVAVLPAFFQGVILFVASALMLRAKHGVQATVLHAARRVVIAAPFALALFVLAVLVAYTS
jgi:hypothetical protein